MKYIALFLCIGGFLGCASTYQTAEIEAPRLLIQYPLPEIPQSIKTPPSHLDMKLFIQEDGSVVKVRLLSQSGSALWDSLAIERIQKWRFLPARQDNRLVSSWFYLHAVIKYVQPLYFPLAALYCTTQEEAESLYTAIERGENFHDIGVRLAADTSRGRYRVLGTINVYSYPEKIRQVLLGLNEGENSRPVRYGNEYVIFRRLEE